MKGSHLPWAKKEQITKEIDLENIFNIYWTSKAHELTVTGQSWSPTSPLTPDGGSAEVVDIGKRSFSMELHFSANASVCLFATPHRGQLTLFA